MPNKNLMLLLVSLPLALTSASAQTVTFTFQPPKVGLKIRQVVDMESKLDRTYEQSQQLISSESKHTQTQQVREIEVLQSDPAGTAKVSVHYAKATTKNRSNLLSRAKPQSVAGNTYHVSRVGEELVVTYPDGRRPSPDEIVIVESNMQAVGRTNPVAQFLNGRTVRWGERLELPAELAAALLGSKFVEQAERVTLTLWKTKRLDGHPAAVFHLDISGSPSSTAQPPIKSLGTVIIASDTCRTLRTNIQAQIDLAEDRGPAGMTFHVTNRGEIRLEITASYIAALSTP